MNNQAQTNRGALTAAKAVISMKRRVRGAARFWTAVTERSAVTALAEVSPISASLQNRDQAKAATSRCSVAAVQDVAEIKPAHSSSWNQCALRSACCFAIAFLLAGCGGKDSSAPSAGGGTAPEASKKTVEIRAKGSDTMIQLATAWAEAYRKVKPNVFVNANGGGTGTGFAALQNNTTDICNASRDIKPDESEKTKSVTGEEVKEFVVAFDALAVYAHPSNPIKEIAVEELREIWAEGGTITAWEQINPAFKGKIVLFGRQNNSGTYDYFREHVCGKKDGKQREFRGGISEMNGSSEVVENVSKTPTSLGYSGMGYKTPNVNWLKVSNQKGEPGVEPGLDVARTGKYPIARKLYLYTAGEPTGEVKAYIDWILSPEGQKIVEKEGFVPLK